MKILQLVGKKILVYNAHVADLIVVSANTSNLSNEKSVESENKQTFFLIDRNTGGVNIAKAVNTIGLSHVNFSEITFDKVVVPQECVLGKLHEGATIFKKILSFGKMNIGAQCCAQLRNLINNTIEHNLKSELFKKPLNECHHIQKEIGKLICDAYVVESMTYLLTGRLYSFADPDVFLESLIIKVSEMITNGPFLFRSGMHLSPVDWQSSRPQC